MIQLVLEYPWVVLGIGIALSIASIQAALQLGQKALFGVSAALLLLAIGLCYLGNIIETERESVTAMLIATANSLEKGDLPTVFEAIYPNPSANVLVAKGNLERVTIEKFYVTKFFEFSFSGPETARRAKVALNIFVEGNFGRYPLKHPRYLEIVLYRVKDRWLVYDYKDSNPMQGFKDRLNPDATW